MKSIKNRKNNSRHAGWTAWVSLIILVGLLAVGCGSKTPEEMYQKAEEQMQKGDAIGMMVQCEKIINQAPDSPAAQKARMLLAQTSAQSGGFDEAREYWQAIIDSTGLDEEIGQLAYSFTMQSYAMEQDYDRAIEETLKTSPMLEGHPQLQQSAQRFLAQLYHETGKKETAYELMENLRVNAEVRDLYWFFTNDMVAMMARDEQFDEAAGVLQASLDEAQATSPSLQTVNPERYATLHLQMAELYAAAEQNDKAMAILRKIRDEATSPEEYMRYTEEMVKILSSKEEYLQAADVYTEYIEKYPESNLVAETHFGIAFFNHRAAKTTEDETKAAELEKSAESYFKQAMTKFEERRKMAVLDQDIARASISIGQSYSAMDKTEEAIAAFEYVLENTTRSQAWLTALEQIAMLYMGNNEFDKAISTFRTMQSTFSDSQDIVNSANQAIAALEERANELRKLEVTSATLQEALPTLPDLDLGVE